jgi:hypothetical protein
MHILLCSLVLNRIVRNAAWLLDAYVHTFDAKWNKTAGEATALLAASRHSR